MHIVSYSGGKDSTAMLLLMLHNKMPIDKIVFVDTGKEYPDLYLHNDKVNNYLKSYGLYIDVIKIDFDYWFSEHIKTKGKNKGSKGYGWPTPQIRWCTSLKREAIKKYAKQFSNNIVEYHGIAFDESERQNKNVKRNIKYPLIDFKFTEKDALEYCYKNGFDWNGLYKKVSRVSCYCCPLARISNLRSIRHNFPKLWSNIMEMDSKTDTSFRFNKTLSKLEDYFKSKDENNQINIFKDCIE
jgi:3'-phosphoadenosine 5'-phosphosulfate sulfotransferase (PAPS reductase)/FAD synthetase